MLPSTLVSFQAQGSVLLFPLSCRRRSAILNFLLSLGQGHGSRPRDFHESLPDEEVIEHVSP